MILEKEEGRQRIAALALQFARKEGIGPDTARALVRVVDEAGAVRELVP